MKFRASDPDIETIVKRIGNGDIKLQPDFQRGEVWSDKKKKRLIDTILRSWQIPPIHVIEIQETSIEEVLDGQQRLVAIRDFFNGSITIDGNIEPIDVQIKKLDGLTYRELDEKTKRNFNKYPIRFFTIYDYNPDEPGELFFRLNQPTNLTSAEQRNAYFGPARQQIKDLVKKFETNGLTPEIIGFSNSRMAYDDVISKLCFVLELGTLRKKITSSDISDKFRSKEEFSVRAIKLSENAISIFTKSTNYFLNTCKFNKATLFGWLCFIIEYSEIFGDDIDTILLGEFISTFEFYRNSYKNPSISRNRNFLYKVEFTSTLDEKLMLIFNQKASASSTDVSAIVIRDLIIWILFVEYTYRIHGFSIRSKQLSQIWENFFESSISNNDENIMFHVDYFIDRFSWGENI